MRREICLYQQNGDESEQTAAALREEKRNARKHKTPSAQRAKNRIRAAGCKGQTEWQHQIEVSGKTVIVLKKRGDAPFPCRDLGHFILNWVEHVVERGITTCQCLPKSEEHHDDGRTHQDFQQDPSIGLSLAP